MPKMGKHDINNSLERPGLNKDVKVVVVGPAKSGKTALVQRFVNDTFSSVYVPTGFEKYSKTYKIREYTIQYSIWDTSGSGSYDTVRPLAYQDANVFLLCFNIGDPESLDVAINKWYTEIRSHCSTTPVVLCGCRADSRSDIEVISYLAHAHKLPITTEQAIKASQYISATAFVETSSSYVNQGVNEAFEVAADAALDLSFNDSNCSPKKKKFSGSQSPIPMKTNKSRQIKENIGKAGKNCCIM